MDFSLSGFQFVFEQSTFLGVINGGFLFHSIQIISPFLCHKNNKNTTADVALDV